MLTSDSIAAPIDLAQLFAERSRFSRFRWARNTVIAYDHDWSLFQRWCDNFKRASLPASTETVGLYLADILGRGRKIATASRRLCSIAHCHKVAGADMPNIDELRELLIAAQRIRGEKPRQVKPLLLSDLSKIARLLLQAATPRAIRDRAIVVFGFASALRRSNLVALDLAEVEFTNAGLIVQVNREKQDQMARGRLIGIPRGRHRATCPVLALRQWLDVRGPAPGPLFTHVGNLKRLVGPTISRVVKMAVSSIGLNAAEYGAHSLRAGFVTAAGESGASELLIASQTGHRSMDVLRSYFRRQNLFKANACAGLGL